MNNFYRLAVSALLAGGLFYLAFFTDNDPAENSISTRAATNEPDTANRFLESVIPDPIPEATDKSKSLENSALTDAVQASPERATFEVTSFKSYADILQDISNPFWKTSDGISFRRQARFSCLFSLQGDMKRQAKNPEIFKHNKSRLLSIAFLEKFCGDAMIESREAIGADRDVLPHSDDVYRASGLIELAETDLDLAVTLAADLIGRSKSGEAIEMAMDFLSDERVQVDLGQEHFPGVDARQSLLRAREIAAQMVSCDYSRLCGPDSLRAWVECVHPGVCQPGVSMQLIWQRSNSPQIYEGAVAIANQLRAMRRTP